MARYPTDAAQQRIVEAWNARYPVGTRVRVRMDLGGIVETKTRSRAELLSGHTAVIWLDDIVGAYALERVTAVDEAEVGPGAEAAMARRTENLVDRLLASLGIHRLPAAEAARRLREAAEALEAAIGNAGTLTIHELSDEADNVRARQRLA